METQTQNPSPSPQGGKGTKFLAGVGIIALLVAAVWLGIQAVQFGSSVTSGLASSFSSVRSLFGSENSLVLEANPGVIASTQNFVLSWEHEEEETDGSYIFSYECTPGVHLESAISENNGNVIFCNTPFNFLNNENKLEFSAITVNEDPTEIIMQVHFTPSESNEPIAAGETRITVVDDPAKIASIAGIATTTDENANNTGEEDDGADNDTEVSPPPPSTTPGNPTFITENIDIPAENDPNGTPDLTVRILEVGTVTSSGNFSAQTGALDPDDRLAVKFEIINSGTRDSGSWNFEAKLPTEPRHTYNSRDQETLFPGARVEYTLGFTRAEDDEERVRFEVIVDPDEDIDEEDENNNNAIIFLNIEQ